jgi:DNA-binding NtrC family response regulator
MLARHFLAKYARLHGSPAERFAPDATAALLAHRWPGNVRELENTVQRAVVLALGADVDAGAIVLETVPTAPAVAPAGRTMTQIQRDLVLGTLERMGGNRTHTARALGVSARTIRNHLRRYRTAAAADQG